MTNRMTGKSNMARTIALSTVAMTLLFGANAAQAQGPGGFGGGPGGPMGRMPGMQPANVLTTPIEALQVGLTLSADQKTKIVALQEASRKLQESLRPQFPQGGERPSQEEMQALFTKMREGRAKMDEENAKAEKEIMALLTTEQKAALPAFLKEVENWNALGLPLPLYATLKLSDDQKTKINELGRQTRGSLQTRISNAQAAGGDPRTMRDSIQKLMESAHTKALAFLTEEQKAMVEKWDKDHPRPQRGPGGRGGFGGPGGFGGGPGGPPPAGAPGDAPPPPAN